MCLKTYDTSLTRGEEKNTKKNNIQSRHRWLKCNSLCMCRRQTEEEDMTFRHLNTSENPILTKDRQKPISTMTRSKTQKCFSDTIINDCHQTQRKLCKHKQDSITNLSHQSVDSCTGNHCERITYSMSEWHILRSAVKITNTSQEKRARKQSKIGTDTHTHTQIHRKASSNSHS